MSLLKSELGKKSDSHREEVTAERILSFCRAVGIRESLTAPPTFLTVFRKGEFELFQKLGVQLSQVLHAEQEYSYEAPLLAGDLVTFQTTLSNVLEKQGGSALLQFLTFETQFEAERTSGEKPVSVGKSRTTIVIRR